MRWLALLLVFGTAWAGQTDLTWTEPTLNEDGTPLTDLTSYAVYSGCQTPGQYERPVEVLLAPATTYSVTGLPDTGTCYFALKALNSQGAASVLSNEAVNVVGVLALSEPVENLNVTWQESEPPVMAVTHIGEDTDSTGSGTTVSAGGTLSMTDDDLLVALITMNGDGVTVTGLAGFTSLDAGNGGGGGGHSYAILYKTASSDSGDFTFTVSSTTRISLILVQVRGATAMEPDAAVVTDGWEVASASIEYPDITVADNSIAIGYGIGDTNTWAANTHTDTTDGYTFGLDVADQIATYDWKVYATGAATTEVKHNRSAAIDHTGFHFSFKESAAGGATVLGRHSIDGGMNQIMGGMQ